MPVLNLTKVLKSVIVLIGVDVVEVHRWLFHRVHLPNKSVFKENAAVHHNAAEPFAGYGTYARPCRR